MTRYELLKTNKTLVQMMFKNKITCTEVAYLEVYEKYLAMKNSGEYRRYIMAVLSEESGIPVRTIYDIIRRFESEINLDT